MTKGSLGFNVLGFRGCLATRFPDDPLSCERTSAQSTLDMLRGERSSFIEERFELLALTFLHSRSVSIHICII